jgi:hypothetical protein
MILPAKVCEMATLLIRSKGRIIQTRKRRFGRVPYSGPSADPRTLRTERDQRSQRLRSTSSETIRNRRFAQTKLFRVCRIPYRRPQIGTRKIPALADRMTISCCNRALRGC